MSSVHALCGGTTHGGKLLDQGNLPPLLMRPWAHHLSAKWAQARCKSEAREMAGTAAATVASACDLWTVHFTTVHMTGVKGKSTIAYIYGKLRRNKWKRTVNYELLTLQTTAVQLTPRSSCCRRHAPRSAASQRQLADRAKKSKIASLGANYASHRRRKLF